jgi:MCP family monocarboxylic acid transporter-like MFS transporter 10
MRALGFIFLGTLAIANLVCHRLLIPHRTYTEIPPHHQTLRTRLPPHPSGPLIPFAAFKSPAYALYCLSAFLMWLGIYTPLTYLEISGVKAGLTPAMAFGLIPIVNGLSLVGRLAAGALAVKYGPVSKLLF